MPRVTTAYVSNADVNREPSTGTFPETIVHHGKVWLVALVVRPT